MPATIRDVAKLAGTSVSAVSAVLNGRKRHNIRVGEETRKRIHTAAAQLRYVPNPLAQSLVTRKTGVLGLVFPFSSAFTDRNPFCSDVMTGIFAAMVRAKYDILLHTAIGEDWNEADEFALLDPRVDGLILVLPTPGSAILARCHREGFPCVALVHKPQSEDIYAVNADDLMGGRIATEHLIGLGHRRIAHLAGNARIATTEPRRQGYLSALEAGGISAEEALVVPSEFTTQGGYEAMQRLLDRPRSQQPTAVFAANDLCAEGAIAAIRENGLRVPEDIAVVGYDDTWFATMTQPKLTSVHMPIDEMAMRAAEMLITLVEGGEVPDRQPVLPISLSVRESCGAHVTASGS